MGFIEFFEKFGGKIFEVVEKFMRCFFEGKNV